MSEKTLRNRLVRLAHAKPALRPHLLPILTHKQASDVNAEIYEYRSGKFIRPATPEEYRAYLKELDEDTGATSGRPYGISGSIYMEESSHRRRLAAYKGDIVQYKGRDYRVEYSGKTRYGHRTKLQFMNGAKSFWIDTSKISESSGSFSGGGRSRSQGSTKPGSISTRQLDYISRHARDWFDIYDDIYPGDHEISKLSAATASEIIREIKSGY